MAGDTSKAGRWVHCDVWNAPLGTTMPTDPGTDPDVAFDLVGFLDGSAGLVKSLDQSSTILKAWGGTPIEDVREFNGESFKFVAVEDNDVVFGLVYPGSDAPTTTTGVTTRVAKVPTATPSAWLIRLSRSDGTIKDYQIPKGVGGLSADVTENETDLGGSEITVNVLANSDNELHTEVIKEAS